LNPADAGDGNADRDGDGYTNLEEYLGSLVGEPFVSGCLEQQIASSLPEEGMGPLLGR
jgi:hypothetical protein